MRLPTLPSTLPSPKAALKINLGRRSGGEVVGLDIQPGFVAAVRARANGSIVAERAAGLALAADIVRDGEVTDADSLAESLRELFGGSGLGKRVRVGVANQRTVLRTLELPPVSDAKELAAAVTFQAQEQVPMPLNNAVLDFHPLGIIDTPAGPRQRVVLVAAQRDMIERLLNAVRGAGLIPVGVDLSAFALIRSLHVPAAEDATRVLYLNIDGLTNLAIAEGAICRFTRVVGGGLESIAGELAVRRGIALVEARTLLGAVDLTAPAPAPVGVEMPQDEAEEEPLDGDGHEAAETLSEAEHAAREASMSFEELSTVPVAPAPAIPVQGPDAEVFDVLETGIREIAGEVRNSLDFHRSQGGGGDVSHIVLSGAAQDIPGFAETLQRALGVEVREAAMGVGDDLAANGVSPHRLAVATGLALTEAPQ